MPTLVINKLVIPLIGAKKTQLKMYSLMILGDATLRAFPVSRLIFAKVKQNRAFYSKEDVLFCLAPMFFKHSVAIN